MRRMSACQIRPVRKKDSWDVKENLYNLASDISESMLSTHRVVSALKFKEGSAGRILDTGCCLRKQTANVIPQTICSVTHGHGQPVSLLRQVKLLARPASRITLKRHTFGESHLSFKKYDKWNTSPVLWSNMHGKWSYKSYFFKFVHLTGGEKLPLDILKTGIWLWWVL